MSSRVARPEAGHGRDCNHACPASEFKQTVAFQPVEVLNLGFTDVDECNENKHDCSADATCENTHGSFNCKCSEGYQGDGVTCAGKPTSGDHAPQSIVSIS